MGLTTDIVARGLLWRGDLSPLGCAAAPKPDTSVCQAERWRLFLGLLRSPAGINPLATNVFSNRGF